MNGIKKNKISEILYNIWNSIGTKYGWHKKRLHSGITIPNADRIVTRDIGKKFNLNKLDLKKLTRENKNELKD
jgi:hypothetical protein